MKQISKILMILALLPLMAACGEQVIVCREEVVLRVVADGQVTLDGTLTDVADLSERFAKLSEDCGGQLIVVIGSDDKAYEQTVVEVFNIVGKDPSVNGVGISKY